MPSVNKPVAASMILVLLGVTLLVMSGLFSTAGTKISLTNVQFLERTGAALVFLFAYLCYFFSRKP